MAITIDGTNGLSSDNAALKLDGTTLVVDEANNRVGVGTASPAVAMDVVGQVRASTGILFGSDTAAANALDDYEEGTWTPRVGRANGGEITATYSLQEGTYTKIGQLVTIGVSITITAVSSQGSDINYIDNFPFTPTGRSYVFNGLLWSNTAFTTSTALKAAMHITDNKIWFTTSTRTASGNTIINENWQAGQLSFSLTYTA